MNWLQRKRFLKKITNKRFLMGVKNCIQSFATIFFVYWFFSSRKKKLSFFVNSFFYHSFCSNSNPAHSTNPSRSVSISRARRSDPINSEFRSKTRANFPQITFLFWSTIIKLATIGTPPVSSPWFYPRCKSMMIPLLEISKIHLKQPRKVGFILKACCSALEK